MLGISRRNVQHFDWLLLGWVVLLVGLGIANLYSATSAGAREGLAPEFRRQLLALLRAEQETLGFAAYLESLAAARVDGLWLDNIQIRHGERRHVRLSGLSQDPLYIPELLLNMAEEEPFEGQRFEQLELDWRRLSVIVPS